MATHRTWLAFDIGTSAAKGALIAADGTILEEASADYPSHTPGAGVVEQHPQDWWQAAVTIATRLTSDAAEAVAITGQMQDLILVGGDGEALRPAILYSDTRAQREATRIGEMLGRETLRELTGNDQEAAGLLAKLAWLQAHEPGALEAAAQLLLGAADYLALRLTGRAVSDTTTASTTGLMMLGPRAWLGADTLQRAGLGQLRRLLPELVPGGSHIGPATPEAQRALGLAGNIPVFLGPGDAVATTLGIGSGSPGKPYAYLGTSGWVAYSSRHRGDPTSGVFTLAHPDPELVVCVAPLLTAGGNLDWIKNLIGADDHGAMIQAALARDPQKLLYLPYLQGERSPFSDPFARGAFVGLETGHERLDLVRAVLEGVAYAYRHALEALVAEPIERLALTGGGARSEAFCQLLADVTGLAVTVPGGAVHAGLLGALQAADPTGSWLQPEARIFVADPDRKAGHDRNYRWYRGAYPALEGLFAAMGEAG